MKYYLIDNGLTPDPTDYRAVVVNEIIRSHKELISMVEHRSVGLTESQISAVLKEYNVAITQCLQRGESVQTDMFTIRPSIKGVFKNLQDSFDRSRHKVRLSITLSAALKKIADILEVQKTEAVKHLPLLNTFVDIATNEVNAVITPGGTARIYGERLKLNMEDEQQGIYFVSEDHQAFKVTSVTDNFPKQLLFNVPSELTLGNYRIEVRSDHSIKEVRTGKLDEILTVA